MTYSLPGHQKPFTSLTRKGFIDYCQNTFSTVMEDLGRTDTVYSATFKSAAAKSLGFASYDELNHQWSCIQAIKNGIYAVQSEEQGGIAIYAGNILAVIRPCGDNEAMIIMSALSNGDEYRELHPNTNYFQHRKLPESFVYGTIDELIVEPDANDCRGIIEMAGGYAVHLNRTHEGLIIDFYLTTGSDDECVDTYSICFNDALGDYSLVDQSRTSKPMEEKTYQWCSVDEDNDDRPVFELLNGEKSSESPIYPSIAEAHNDFKNLVFIENSIGRVVLTECTRHLIQSEY